MKQTTMLVTPTIASKWLAKNVSNNRTIRKADVEHYKTLIEGGRFITTPEGIQLNEDGFLIDGQHRLTAIAETGKSVWMVVWTDVPAEVMEFTNRGRSRSLSDVLTVTGGLGADLPARHLVARAVAVYEIHHPESIMVKRDVPDYEWVKERYLSDLVWTCTSYPGGGGSGGHVGRKIRSAPVMGALAIAHNKKPEEVEEFARRFAKGLDLTESDPAYALRRYLEGADMGGVGRIDFSYAALKAVHSAIHKRRLSVVKGHFLTPENPEFAQVLAYFGVV
jgi:hypothetical protein